jgi:DNA-binding NtrC family response regulator
VIAGRTEIGAAADQGPVKARRRGDRVRRRGKGTPGYGGSPDYIMPRKRTPKTKGGPRTYGRLQRALDEAARREIEAALKETGGQIGEAAAVLGISKVALWKRMKALEIRPPE